MGYSIQTMNLKQTIIIAILWTLFMAPAACLSGALDHSCADCIEVSCGHEVGCSADPCNILLVPVSKSRVNDAPAVDQDFPIDLPECSSARTTIGIDFSQLTKANRGLSSLPMPASALPLRC